jgi:hypothetical protein
MIAGGKPVVIQPATLGRQYKISGERHDPPRPPGLA